MIRVATVSLLLASVFPTAASECFSQSAVVSLTGTINMATWDRSSGSAGDPAHTLKSRYPILTLDKPVCFNSEFGDVPADRTIAVVFTAGGLSRDMVGAHVRAFGKLVHREHATQPPEDLILFNPVLHKVQR